MKKHRVLSNLKSVDEHKRLMLGLPIRKRGLYIPFGYYLAEDGKTCIPNDKELALLYKAAQYCRESSFRDVAEWLTKASGRKISHQGFVKIMLKRFPCKELTLPLYERERLYASPA